MAEAGAGVSSIAPDSSPSAVDLAVKIDDWPFQILLIRHNCSQLVGAPGIKVEGKGRLSS